MREWEQEGKMAGLLQMNGIKMTCLFLANTAAVFINGYVNMMDCRYAFLPLSLLNAFTMFLILFYITRKWEERSGGNKFIFFRILGMIGRDSIVYMLMNQYGIFVLLAVMERLGIERGLISNAVMFVAVMILLMAGSRVMNLPGLRKCIGKK